MTPTSAALLGGQFVASTLERRQTSAMHRARRFPRRGPPGMERGNNASLAWFYGQTSRRVPAAFCCLMQRNDASLAERRYHDEDGAWCGLLDGSDFSPGIR